MVREIIELLRSFALDRNEIAFGHLCTSALAGEGWAIDRITPLIAEVESGICSMIRATDASRPDGGIAKSFTP
jgi:hypothetical protein